jgi:hypothetical protein
MKHLSGCPSGDFGPCDCKQPELQQLLAASALITKLERIASSGVLSLEDEIDARLLIVRAAQAFQFDTLAERPAAEIISINGEMAG